MTGESDTLQSVHNALDAVCDRTDQEQLEAAGDLLVQTVQRVGRASFPPSFVDDCERALPRVSEAGIGSQVRQLLSALADRRYPGYVAYQLLIDESMPDQNLDMASLCLQDAASRERVGWPVPRSNMPADAVRSARESVLASIASALPRYETQSCVQLRRLRWSLLPLSTSHDESLFIRCFQAFECVFGSLAGLGDRFAADGGRCLDVDQHPLVRIVDVFEKCLGAWEPLRTIQWDAFCAFGRHSSAISAVDSPSFRRMHATVTMIARASADRSRSTLRECVARFGELYSRWYAEHERVVIDLVRDRHPNALQIARFLANSEFRKVQA